MSAKPSYEQLVVLLDACIPLLEEAAKREGRRTPDKYGFKEISWQHRLNAALNYIAASGVEL